MPSRSDRVRAARRAVLRDLAEHLERDRAMPDTARVEAVEALIAEFRRRADVGDSGPAPGQEALFAINREAAP